MDNCQSMNGMLLGDDRNMKRALLAVAAAAPLLLAAQAQAQEVIETRSGDPDRVEDVVVVGEATYRNRTDDTAPVLSYDQQYFQRFEPLSVGDALRRVPSVTFLSDVLESDGARLRGLDPGYTQILINGERVPGAGDDRSFFVDRIPAELIEGIEIVRSPSARRSGDAVAGAINIVLRDAYTLDGGYVRGGLRYFDNGEFREHFGATWGGQVGPGRLIASFDMQDRYNPKIKFSQRFDEPADAPNDPDNVELQDDTRDGTDYSFNGAYEVDLGAGSLELSGVYVRTDRTETENSYEYPDGLVEPDNLEVYTPQFEDILSENLSLNAGYDFDAFGGETGLDVGFARYTDELRGSETEFAYLEDGLPFPDVDVVESELTALDLEDTEWSFGVEHERDIASGLTLEIGLDYLAKERTLLIQSAEFEDDTAADFPAPLPAFAYDPFEIADGGDSTIEEQRFEPFVVLSGPHGIASWEAGLRVDLSETTIEDRTVSETVESDHQLLLPSASVRFDLTAVDRIIVSGGRTMRRPSFNFLSPALLEEEIGDSDFLGNPELEPETAWGFDVGYERRLGRRGIAGLNFFYRDVTDLIEFVNTGDEGSEGPGTFIYSVANVGDGQVWGLEFDLSTPLDSLGLPNTGVFVNLSWLDSQVEDFRGERRFNGQSDYAASGGFTHDIPAWQTAFGASWYSQGDAFDRFLAEEVRTSYGDNLEVFLERRFGDNVVLRLTGTNLLNASKDEVFDKFDNEADQLVRDYDEYELESEEAGPVWQVALRWTF